MRWLLTLVLCSLLLNSPAIASGGPDRSSDGGPLRPSLSGSLTWMTKAGPFRYVRASLSRDLTPNQMIATLAHELQHAIEVVNDETVRDEGSLVALYRRIGHPSQGVTLGWETIAAQQAGYQVQRELQSS